MSDIREVIEALHPRLTDVRYGCCAHPKLCNGHADECGGSHNYLNRPTYPCADLLALRAALEEAPEPEYQYGFTNIDGYQSGMVYETVEEARRALENLKRPHYWRVTRRRKAGKWEDLA